MENNFKFVMPANLSKAQDGEWVVAGLASTADTDKQGEIIDQSGMDLTAIDSKKGWFNWDHKPGIENLLGTLDSYTKTSQGLFVKGRLFKNKQKAKEVYEVMSSLDKSDVGRIGMSVEGKIIERCPINPKIIKKCRIDKVALTLTPVNDRTYASLIKSLNVENDDLIKSIVNSDSIEFDSTEQSSMENVVEGQDKPLFTAQQVLEIVQKALGVGSGAMQAPDSRSGGDALAQESLDSKKKKKDSDLPEIMGEDLEKPSKKLKKLSKDMYKSNLIEVLEKLQVLYPECSRSQLWSAVQDRLHTRYPVQKGFRLKQMDGKEREHKLYEDARQRGDYEENKDKSRAQLAETAKESGAGSKERAKIRAQRDAAIQVGEQDHVRPGIKS